MFAIGLGAQTVQFVGGGVSSEETEVERAAKKKKKVTIHGFCIMDNIFMGRDKRERETVPVCTTNGSGEWLFYGIYSLDRSMSLSISSTLAPRCPRNARHAQNSRVSHTSTME